LATVKLVAVVIVPARFLQQTEQNRYRSCINVAKSM